MNLDKRNEDLLREASAFGDEDGVRKLIEAGVDVNSQHSMNGWTGLHWASKRGHASIVRLLMSHGADPNLTSLYGETPLAVAKNEEVHNILSVKGTSENSSEFQIKPSLPITPNYLSNPVFSPSIDQKDIKHSEISYSTKLNNSSENESKRKLQEEIVLKVRIADSLDPDFIEIEIPLHDLSFENVFRICCEELEVAPQNVLKLRKLPNTIIRKDKDVLRLQDFQELELVMKLANGIAKQPTLKTHINETSFQESNRSVISYDSNSTSSSPLVKKSNYCKNGTILY